METHLRSAVVLAVATAAASVSPIQAEGSATPEPKAYFVEATSAEARGYRDAGSYAIDRLVMTMITDSAGAVSRQTEVEALKTFHLKDVPLKNGTVAGLPRITAMKLTSLKLRNPANAPDAAEATALQKVKYDLYDGNPPQMLLQQIEFPDGKVEWRVYKPLANIRQCGSCHGNPDQMSPELRVALQEKYPDDKATGYQLGEWRGLIRVTVGPPPPPPGPPKPASAAPASTKKR